MKKRILALIMGLCMTASLVGCGNGEIANDKIRIKQYKGLEVTDMTMEVTDEQVEQSIQSTLQMHSTATDITDRPAQIGDTVSIAYEGKLTEDGSIFDSSDAYSVELDEEGMGNIDGFEEQIIGHSIGEEFEIKVTFPEDYQATDVAGKDAIFNVTLNSIQEVHVPELTKDLLPQLSETAKTIKEYKAEVRKQLEESNQASAESAMEDAVWEKLLENCVVEKYPDGQIEDFVAQVEAELGEYAAQNNTTAAEVFKMYSNGMSPEDYVKNSVKMEYAVALIAEKENLTLTAKEYEEGVAEQAMQQGYEDAEAFEKEVGRETIELLLLQPKVGKFLLENCKIVEAEATE